MRRHARLCCVLELAPGDLDRGKPWKHSLPEGRPGCRVNRPNDAFWGLLSEADRAALLELGSPCAFEPGNVLCTELEHETQVFILIAGWVKVTTMTSGTRELVLGLRGSGEVVGELAAESDGFRTATVQAVAPVRALTFPHAEFTRFLDDHPSANRAYRRIIVRRWGETAEMLRNRSVSSGPQRLAALLIDLGERHGTPGRGGIVITSPLSQKEIASFIGTSRATVTRALGDWRRRGLISTDRRRITIMNSALLRRIAHKDPAQSAR
jgi:CRP/FNR family transcriptional regulator, cyclic AMP receptor protein